jgi:hypothetical protein
MELDADGDPHPRDDELWEIVRGIDAAIDTAASYHQFSKRIVFRVTDTARVGCANVEELPDLVRLTFSKIHLLRLKDAITDLLAAEQPRKFLRLDALPNRGGLDDHDNTDEVLKWIYERIWNTRLFTMVAAMFIAFHELAHVLDGHLRYIQERERKGIRTPPVARQMLEYDADYFATELLFAHVLTSHQTGQELLGFKFIDDDQAICCATFAGYCAVRIPGFPFDLGGELQHTKHPSGILRVVQVVSLISSLIELFKQAERISNVDGEDVLRRCTDAIESVLLATAPEGQREIARENWRGLWNGMREHVERMQAQWLAMYDELDAHRVGRDHLATPRDWLRNFGPAKSSSKPS